jgi:hypothetical protein
MIQIHVDSAKLPSADALKSLLFQGTFAVASDDASIRFVRRQAFPNLLAPIGSMGMAVVLPALQKARGPAGGAPGGPLSVPLPGGPAGAANPAPVTSPPGGVTSPRDAQGGR